MRRLEQLGQPELATWVQEDFQPFTLSAATEAYQLLYPEGASQPVHPKKQQPRKRQPKKNGPNGQAEAEPQQRRKKGSVEPAPPSTIKLRAKATGRQMLEDMMELGARSNEIAEKGRYGTAARNARDMNVFTIFVPTRIQQQTTEVAHARRDQAMHLTGQDFDFFPTAKDPQSEGEQSIFVSEDDKE